MKLVTGRSIGAVILLGFVFLVVGALVAPSGAYSGSIDERLTVIASNETQWLISKVFDSLAVIFGVGGMVMLAANTTGTEGGWLNTAAGFAFGIGGLAGLVWTVLLVIDPGPLYDRDAPAPIVVLFIALIAIGLLAIGLDYLRSQSPRWLAWLLIAVGAAVLAALVLIIVSGAGPESAFGLGSLMYLVIAAVGIRLIIRGRREATDQPTG